MGLGLGESLAQVEQQNGIQKGQIGTTQKSGYFQVARFGLTGKGHLQITVDYQL